VFRAEVIGSMLRPSYLKEARAAFQRGSLSGSFEPLSRAPDDKQVVLGLVSTKKPDVEAPKELIARIEEAARLFSREQLALSTQCGFASVADGNPISEQAEESKLRVVADVARTVWA
jgi:5-methyltetrahydropteroyltriglutamate--homocysteine methyltransferase